MGCNLLIMIDYEGRYASFELLSGSKRCLTPVFSVQITIIQMGG